MKVAIVTCKKLPEPDVDQELLTSALTARGAHVRMLPWDDDGLCPDDDELVVIRSTWNYFEDVERFLAWVTRTGKATRLYNPASVIRRNAKKTYLRELEERGIDVVPTEWAMRDPGNPSPKSVDAIMRERGWETVVIKPVVSAGSFKTQRFDASTVEGAQRFLDELRAERDVMIQRWMPSVDTYGERSLVWIDGDFTHAIRKSPRFVGGHEAVSGEVPIAPKERAFAERVLEPIRDDILYARVDMVEDETGKMRLMELELIEPSLFLKQCPAALDRLVAGIVSRAER
jgi:hypothetical protein